MKINPHSGHALYQQIADDLRDRIESGNLQPGEELPSEVTLKIEYEVGAGTIRRAIPVLARKGLIVSERGQHRRVAEPEEPETVVVGLGSKVVAHVTRPRDAQEHGARGRVHRGRHRGRPEWVYLASRDSGTGRRTA